MQIFEVLKIFFYAFFELLPRLISTIWDLRFVFFDIIQTIKNIQPLNLIAIYLGIPTIIFTIIKSLYKLSKKN